MNKTEYLLIFATIIVFMPLIASANDGTPPWIYDLTQENQDVQVTLAIVQEGEPGLEQSYTLLRAQGSSSKAVFSDHIFGIEESFDMEVSCRWWQGEDPQHCIDYPEECIDCDGDETPECYGWCDHAFLFNVLDSCVPPGSTHYTLCTDDNEWPEDEADITVNDSGVECPDDDSGAADDDTGNDDTNDDDTSDDDSSSGGGGCGC